ncbi:His-Xaa-Ser system radical SAM maturase HxsB [Legionella bononiensis]|uniref:His-Xaa-Ser system radical SAM maturase HxsB n=1 Tax=Legionella bononiensis TaxID=2793102 RepID=A0ABS1W8T1_9GAMM|nr:His-Xaa-Ser system radical SAM maturase HxsB [Legionella bononiensis]MBL7479715.1 His-Xaa-Ser system radical SAM maturase HxsB [Legionella bononiensis]MBL7525772.1 His-Xaa-Ser system radical SAM maturase HxsB [Legionella bononiensis]MBL7561954.1 His-Xaa-Ser system radical SAM maturase HxsB [Legionella bononiensis]
MTDERLKFKPLSYYDTKKDVPYNLLPFNFTSLDSNRYVVTNLAGEYVVLTKIELNHLITKQLLAGTETYNNLIAKHFIYDHNSDVAIPLLALKYRTKKNNLSDFTNLHIFVVSLRCDHSCPYCQVSRQIVDNSRYDMTHETADKGIEFAFKSPSRSLKFEFQGGESLLNFDLIKYIVLTVEQRNLSENRDIQFVIATNLVFINDEILNFCNSHHILISTSLDGPEDLHNKNRPRPGKNSHQITIQGINKSREVLGHQNVSALMTTTKSSLTRGTDIIDEYIKHGFNSIFLRPLSPYGFAIKTKNYKKYDTQEWLKFYFDGLDYIIEINKNGHYFAEQYASIILTKMFTPSEPGYVDLQSPAGIGLSAIVFNYDGNVYASDEARMLAEMKDETFKLGNLHHDSYEAIIGSDKLLDILEQTMSESVPGCTECAFQPYCGSDPVFHHATQGDMVGNKPKSVFCYKNMEIFKHLIRLMDDKDTRNVLLSWVRG